MKDNKKAPKSQLESRIIQSVKDSLQGKVKCIIAFHTINVSRYHAVVKQIDKFFMPIMAGSPEPMPKSLGSTELIECKVFLTFFPVPYLCKVSLPNLLNFYDMVG